MTDKIDDGGPAFPRTVQRWNDSLDHSVQGMSLRDYFAGQIAGGMAAFSGTFGISFGPGDIATRSYQVADAMLAARVASS